MFERNSIPVVSFEMFLGGPGCQEKVSAVVLETSQTTPPKDSPCSRLLYISFIIYLFIFSILSTIFFAKESTTNFKIYSKH